MTKGLIALCIVVALQVSSAYEVAVPVAQQPHVGIENPLIIGGKTAAKWQFPHQAGITIDFTSFCGGSLISSKFVLTAAHCVSGHFFWSVTLGAHELRNANEPGRITLSSLKGIVHEGWNSAKVANDIALIQLYTALDFNEQINAIALPPRSFQNKNFAGQTVRVSGWGKTSDTSGVSPTLQFVDLPLISLEECRAVYGPEIITNTKYCTSGANQRNICNGDSGGPLTVGSGSTLTEIGIVSFGAAKSCLAGLPSGFTAVPHFVDWISSKTGIPVQE